MSVENRRVFNILIFTMFCWCINFLWIGLCFSCIMLQVYEELLDEDDFFTDSDEFSEIGYEDPYVKCSNKEIKDHLLGL